MAFLSKSGQIVKWKTLANGLFLLTCLFSSLTLFPSFAFYRYPYFERYLDVFYWVFIMCATKVDHVLPPKVSYALIAGMALVSVSAIFAWNHFGIIYVFVEYRQYIIIIFTLAISRILRLRIIPETIVATFPVYLLFSIVNFVLGYVYEEQYRPGVFGEFNYDLAYMAVVVLAKYSVLGEKYNPIISLAFFAFVSQSRTAAVIVLLLSVISRITFKSFIFLVGAVFVVFVIFWGRLWDQGDSDAIAIFEQLDRFQMLSSYLDTIKTSSELAAVGQSISGLKYTAERMDYYRETQLVSQLLGINTPSNYHGHLLRGFVLLGIIPYSVLIFGVLKQARLHFGSRQFIFIGVVLFSTAITQSIFSHPFAGGMFAAVCLLGFSKSRLADC